MNKQFKDRTQLYFGIKCVLLAFAILVLSGSVIYPYIVGETLSPIDLALRAASAFFVSAVLYFEITSYR